MNLRGAVGGEGRNFVRGWHRCIPTACDRLMKGGKEGFERHISVGAWPNGDVVIGAIDEVVGVEVGREGAEVHVGRQDTELDDVGSALDLFDGGGDTMYRIHGTNAPSSIGTAASSGCIRMLNREVVELFNNTPVGTKVIVK